MYFNYLKNFIMDLLNTDAGNTWWKRSCTKVSPALKHSQQPRSFKQKQHPVSISTQIMFMLLHNVYLRCRRSCSLWGAESRAKRNYTSKRTKFFSVICLFLHITIIRGFYIVTLEKQSMSRFPGNLNWTPVKETSQVVCVCSEVFSERPSHPRARSLLWLLLLAWCGYMWSAA